jgi:hypothetical protein
MSEGEQGQIGYPVKDRDPNSTGGSCARGVLVVVGVVLLVVALIVASFVSQLNESLGGKAYAATDSTVSAARAKSAATMDPTVERTVSAIAPALGQPSMRALVDGCETARPESFNNDIECDRNYYLFYAASSEPAGFVADDLTPLLAQAAGWHSDTSMPCSSTYAGQTAACVWSDVAGLQVLQNGASTESWQRMPVESPIEQVEGGGYDELKASVLRGPGVLLICSSRYFFG